MTIYVTLCVGVEQGMCTRTVPCECVRKEIFPVSQLHVSKEPLLSSCVTGASTNPNVSADDVAFLMTASPSMPLRGLLFARGGRHWITSHARLIAHAAYPLAAPPAARLTEQTRAPLNPCLCRYQKSYQP